MRPRDAAYFQERFQDFDKRLTAAEQKWEAEMKPYRGRKVVTYHRSFPNFAKHFGLDVIGYVEPRPGIPPTPTHTLDTDPADEARELQGRAGRALLRPEDTHSRSGAKPARRWSCTCPRWAAKKEVTNYFKLFDYDIGLLIKAFSATQ